MRAAEGCHSVVLLSAAIFVVAGTPAPAGTPRQGPATTGTGWVLRSASVRVAVESSRAGRVDAEYELAGDGVLELLLARFPDQTLSELLVALNGEPVDVESVTTAEAGIERLRFPAATGASLVHIGYSVVQGIESRFRFPLAVPRALPAADTRPVRLIVTLPPEAGFGGDGLPRFDRVDTDVGGTLLEARLIGVPAFTYVAFGDEVTPWRTDLMLELGALALVAAFFIWWADGRRRRMRRAGANSGSAAADPEGGAPPRTVSGAAGGERRGAAGPSNE